MVIRKASKLAIKNPPPIQLDMEKVTNLSYWVEIPKAELKSKKYVDKKQIKVLQSQHDTNLFCITRYGIPTFVYHTKIGVGYGVRSGNHRLVSLRSMNAQSIWSCKPTVSKIIHKNKSNTGVSIYNVQAETCYSSNMISIERLYPRIRTSQLMQGRAVRNLGREGLPKESFNEFIRLTAGTHSTSWYQWGNTDGSPLLEKLKI